MELKLDENFDTRLVPELLKEGFDVDTVIAEGLAGSPDETIYDTCKAVGRTLVTLDLDFSNPLRFFATAVGQGQCQPGAREWAQIDPGRSPRGPDADRKWQSRSPVKPRRKRSSQGSSPAPRL